MTSSATHRPTRKGGAGQPAPLDAGLVKCSACHGLGTSDGQPWSYTRCTWCHGAGFFPMTDAIEGACTEPRIEQA